MSNLVIYHGYCSDGIGAAWAAWKKLGANAVYQPAIYGEHFPYHLLEPGTTIYLCDFSYPADVIKELCSHESVDKIVVLDHHISALTELSKLIHPKLDMLHTATEYSGSVITHKYFFPADDTPPILLYIQDRDLWRFNLPGTEEITAYVASFEPTIENFSSMARCPIKELYEVGKALLRLRKKDVASIIKTCTSSVRLGDRIVPAANCSGMYASEVGEILAKGQPFSITWYINKAGYVKMSLRSTVGVGEDVSLIASQYGGGGHKHAAGISMRFGVPEFEPNPDNFEDKQI